MLVSVGKFYGRNDLILQQGWVPTHTAKGITDHWYVRLSKRPSAVSVI